MCLLKPLRITNKLVELKRKDNEMEKDIRDKYPSVHSYEDLPTIGAFIVFDDVEACNRCYTDYRVSNRYLYQTRLKFLEKHNLKIQYADEPVNINWENLEVGKCESFWRSSVVIVIAIVSYTIFLHLETSNIYVDSIVYHLCTGLLDESIPKLLS